MLVEFSPNDFIKHTHGSRFSRAEQGLCSVCWKPRKAIYTLVTFGRPKLALCRIHGRLRQLKEDMEEVREEFDFDEKLLRAVADY